VGSVVPNAVSLLEEVERPKNLYEDLLLPGKRFCLSGRLNELHKFFELLDGIVEMFLRTEKRCTFNDL
jgi:hypothetical protein